MPPIEKLAQLNTKTSVAILVKALKNYTLKSECIEVKLPTIPNPAIYLIDEQNKQIIFATPLNTVNVSDYLSALQEKLGAERLDNYHLILPVIGNGIAGQHIATLYKPKGCAKKAFVIDSKTSDPESFFKPSKQNLLQTFKGAFKGVFRALIPNYQTTLQPNDFYFESIDYLSTGYQSYFDGISCGYHTLSTILKLVLIIEEKEALSSKALRSSLNSVSNDPLIKESLPRALNEIIYLEQENTSFLRYRDYIALAWNKTFFNGVDEQTRKKQKFQHIVFGWPLENRLSDQIIYFLSLTFILHPLQLLINLIITLPINLITETFQYWQDNVFLAENKASITQYARSALLLIIYPLLDLSKTLRFITTQLFSLLTPFEKTPGVKESKLPAKNTLLNKEESFAEIENDDYFLIEKASPKISSIEQKNKLDPSQEKEEYDEAGDQNSIDQPSKATSSSQAKLLSQHGVLRMPTNSSSEGPFSDSRQQEQTPLIGKTNTSCCVS